jgi:hypothetical protein
VNQEEKIGSLLFALKLLIEGITLWFENDVTWDTAIQIAQDTIAKVEDHNPSEEVPDPE